MPFGDLHRRVSEDDGHFFQPHTGKEGLDGKRIAEHVRVAAFRRSISRLQAGEFEQLPIAPLPVRYVFVFPCPVQKKYCSFVFPFWLAGTLWSIAATCGGIGQ
jgi:hypothetical protein